MLTNYCGVRLQKIRDFDSGKSSHVELHSLLSLRGAFEALQQKQTKNSFDATTSILFHSRLLRPRKFEVKTRTVPADVFKMSAILWLSSPAIFRSLARSVVLLSAATWMATTFVRTSTLSIRLLSSLSVLSSLGIKTSFCVFY